MPKKLHILCDLDSIVADLLPAWVNVYNATYNDTLTIEQITEFDTHKFCKPECGIKVYDLLTGELFESLPPVLGAIDGLKSLMAHGHTVHIVTAYSGAQPDSARAKVQWIRDKLPFIDRHMVTLTSQKHLISADVIIDDRADTIEKCAPSMFKATIAYPYNKTAQHLYNVYAEDYRQPIKCWNEIVKGILEFANT
jgi:5'-nucleotidase